MLNFLFDFLFPPRCVGCGSIGLYICLSCRKKLSFRPPLCPECDRPAINGITHPGCKRPLGLDGLITVCRYEKAVKNAIKLLKYRLVSDCAQEIVSLIPVNTFTPLPTDLVMYPIPLHTKRLRWRGFNQAEILGKQLAKRLHRPLMVGLLERKAIRTPQAEIASRTDRLVNMRGIFSVKIKQIPPSILLIDDVYTTGATVKEACHVLKRHGAKTVWGLTIAR